MADKKNTLSTGPRLKIQARIMLDEEIAFGPGKADLLAAIASIGSITAAGKHLGMSYRRAWTLVDSMNRCFKNPLVESVTGGNQGGGTRLTATGIEVLNYYKALRQDIQAINTTHSSKFLPLLRKKPLSSIDN
jgi:molybdate transport system regulatory protein